MTPQKIITLLLCIATLQATHATNHEEKSSLPTPLTELASRIQIHGYAQAGFTYAHRNQSATNSFDLKRSLLWADAEINDRWSFLFMHDFSSVVQEYYTDFRLTNNKALTVRFGQFKNALTFENALSPTGQETIDVYSEGVTYLTGCGSDPLLGVQYGRDLGVSLYGETNNGNVRYELNIMNGQGVNCKDDNAEKDFIGKLEWRPAKGLNFIATGQIGRGHAIATSPYNPEIKLGDNYKRNRWSAGFDFTSNQLKVHGEYLEGKDGKVTSRGAYITTCIPIKAEKFDLVASYDFFNFNTSLGMDQHKVVAGLQYWFYKKCRFQVQYVYKSAGVIKGTFRHTANHAILYQMQLRFN